MNYTTAHCFRLKLSDESEIQYQAAKASWIACMARIGIKTAYAGE